MQPSQKKDTNRKSKFYQPKSKPIPRKGRLCRIKTPYVPQQKQNYWLKNERLEYLYNITNDAYQMAKTLLSWRQAEHVPAHPTHLRQTAQICIEMAKVSEHQGETGAVISYLGEARDCFEEALSNCDHPAFSDDESKYNELIISSYYVEFLKNYGNYILADVGCGERIQDAHKTALELLYAPVYYFGVNIDWLKSCADNELEHDEAKYLYFKCRRIEQENIHFYLKEIGALYLSGKIKEALEQAAKHKATKEDKMDWLNTSQARRTSKFYPYIWYPRNIEACEKLREQIDNYELDAAPHVIERYEAGLSVFLDKTKLIKLENKPLEDGSMGDIAEGWSDE